MSQAHDRPATGGVAAPGHPGARFWRFELRRPGDTAGTKAPPANAPGGGQNPVSNGGLDGGNGSRAGAYGVADGLRRRAGHGGRLHDGRRDRVQLPAAGLFFSDPTPRSEAFLSNGMDQQDADDKHHRTGYAMN